MNLDCLSRIREMAYLHLSVHCEECGVDLEIKEEASEPIEEWAKQAAEHAARQGWGCLDACTIVCPKCGEKE